MAGNQIVVSRLSRGPVTCTGLITWLSDGTRKAQEKLVFEPIDNQEALKLKNYMTQPDFQWKVANK